MPITIINDLLSNFNPAYNDSYIEFTTDLTGVTPMATITLSTGEVFKIQGYSHKYFFNFKNIITSKINQNNFKDLLIPNLYTSSIYDDNTLTYTLTFTIAIDTLSLTKSYKFTKNVEQLIGYNDKINSSNSIKILLPSRNNIDYYLPYFEGFPLDFAINGLINTDTFFIKNQSTFNQSDTITVTTDKAKRIYVSDGANNEFLTNVIGLSSTINKCEIYTNGLFKANLQIKRNESRCGVYLKWFNSAGAYSYWLFEQVSNNITTSTIDEISSVDNNLQFLIGDSQITGKKGERKLNITTNFKQYEQDYISDILTSPFVQMYIYNEPFRQMTPYSFINVKVSDGSMKFQSKNSNYKMSIVLELPNITTQTL